MGRESLSLIENQFSSAQNMTDEASALSILINMSNDKNDSQIESERQNAINIFYEKYKDDVLVMNKWLAIQASSKQGDVISAVKSLLSHPAYDAKNPNKMRAVIGSFSRNYKYFHQKDGAGYALIADQIKEIDAFNPLMAARLVQAYRKYKKCDPERQLLIKHHLTSLSKLDLSKNTAEMVHKMLEN